MRLFSDSAFPLPFPKGRGQGWGLTAMYSAQCPMTVRQLPLPFPKGEGSGVGFGSNAQCIMPNDCQAASPPLSKRLLKKYRQIIDLLHDVYIQT